MFNGRQLTIVKSLNMRKIFVLLTLVLLRAIAFGENGPFEIYPNDRVALVGDTFVEREQEYGWLETILYTRFADRHFTVRNVGWSGDTPMGESRAGFDFS